MTSTTASSSSRSAALRTTQIMVVPHPRRMLPILLLTAALGPIGLLLASPTAGVVMFVATLGLALPTKGLSLLATQPLCVLWAWLALRRRRAGRS